MTISAKEFEEGLAKREVREITTHTQAVDLAESDRAQIAALGEKMQGIEQTLRDVAELSLKTSHEQERYAAQMVDWRKRVADAIDDTIATVAAQLKG